MDGRGPPGPGRRDGRAAALPGPAAEARLTRDGARFAIAALAALAAGLALAWMETRPGFDDTGVLVGLLVLAGIGVVILAGAPSIARALVLGVLVGVPTPIIEIPNGGQPASIAALIFALAATLISSFILRVMHGDGGFTTGA